MLGKWRLAAKLPVGALSRSCGSGARIDIHKATTAKCWRSWQIAGRENARDGMLQRCGEEE